MNDGLFKVGFYLAWKDIFLNDCVNVAISFLRYSAIYTLRSNPGVCRFLSPVSVPSFCPCQTHIIVSMHFFLSSDILPWTHCDPIPVMVCRFLSPVSAPTFCPCRTHWNQYSKSLIWSSIMQDTFQKVSIGCLLTQQSSYSITPLHGTATLWWLNSGSLVAVDNCLKNGDCTVDHLCSHLLLAVNNADYTFTVQSPLFWNTRDLYFEWVFSKVLTNK